MLIELKDSDNDKTIKASKDDIVSITLVWKPSSGFLWQASDTTAGVLQSVKHEGDNPTPGGNAYVTFKFQILKTGILEFNLARPWAEHEPPVRWFTVNINV